MGGLSSCGTLRINLRILRRSNAPGAGCSRSASIPAALKLTPRGSPGSALAVEPGESAEVELVIDAAEATDPDGNPSFWDLARQKHIYLETAPAAQPTSAESHPHSFLVGWRPIDSEREVAQAFTDMHLREGYVERGE